MSQRTRNRTTAAAARKRPPASASPSSSTAPAADTSATPSPCRARGPGGEDPSASSAVSPSASPSPRHGVAARPASPLPGGEDASLSPETLARTLRAVADELERDRALARRVASAIAADTPAAAPAADALFTEAPSARPDLEPASSTQPKPTKQRAARTFTPSLVTGVSPDLGPGIPDPFALAKRLGPDGLRGALAELRRGTLRAIIREHGIAPAAQVAHITDDIRLREMILAAVLK
ncbi:MAG TPA: hypothetical protein VF116_16855 [Ktedonobacterales bacterium]